MTCGRAYEVDLAAFLRDPRAPELAEFVEHYPRCPECAAEVRAWTEVHLTLGARHPAPAELLAYQDGTLDGDTRAQVEHHLATCAGCAEELRALRRFDAVRPSAPMPDSERRASPSPARRIGRMLWHPAVAYAVALLLLVPVLVQRPWKTPPPPSQPARHDELEERLATSSPPRSVEADRPVPPPAPAAEPAPHADTYQRRELSPDSKLQAPAAGAAAPETARKRAAAPGPTLDEDRRTLTVPLVPPLRPRDTIEVRVRDATGTRELRLRVAPSEDGDRVLAQLPREFLTPGEWTVEIEAPDGPRRFALRVR